MLLLAAFITGEEPDSSQRKDSCVRNPQERESPLLLLQQGTADAMVLLQRKTNGTCPLLLLEAPNAEDTRVSSRDQEIEKLRLKGA